MPYLARGDNSGGFREVLKVLAEKGLDERDLNIIWRLENSCSVINAVSEGLGVSVISWTQSSKYVKAGLVGFVPFDTETVSYLKLIDHWRAPIPLSMHSLNS